ncbi:HNH endonuclease [Burkholderia phage BcepMigl]|uniref:HNH endonuclease n=1 Tax=Burkholderia phage BcepMigl TaxID=2886899 RepID=I6WB06_9CAUD|nr:HNH endonuclease [Burkholderia phage BcepMigl]AFN39090.1 HNH endonuclease [Burkholderia phage BcepMigl]
MSAPIPIEVITCPELTWQARGVLIWAIHHETPITEELVREHAAGARGGDEPRPVGRDGARAIINEIVGAGFARYVPGGAAYLKTRIPDELRQAVFERDGFRCVECGSNKRLCADHIIPESAGGPTTLENLQTMCRPCNSEKGDKAPV